MDMTKDYLNRTLELAEPHTIEYEGRLFVDKDMSALSKEPCMEAPLCTSSLSSIVDYITQGVDAGAFAGGRLIVHVEGSRAVRVYRELNGDKRRDFLISAAPVVSSFPFGRFMDVESFIINLQANFVQEENTAALLAFVGSVKTDSGVEQNDDGISQKVTARSGVSLVTSAKVPNPISLGPYRTFSEVEQPQSPFVFRVRSEERAGVSMALFEADGKAWEHAAICSIRDYFTDKLDGHDVIILA